MHFARLAATVALFSCAAQARAEHPFTYVIPDGWTDLSPGAPDAAFRNLHPGIVREAQSGRFVAFAMDLRTEDGFYEGMNALVREGALTTDDDLSVLVPELEDAYQLEFKAPVRVVEADHAEIGNVRAIRVVYDVSLPARTLRQEQYLMPGGLDWYTVVTYSTVPERYERYRKTFATSASATGGVAEAKAGLSIATLGERIPELASSIFLLTLVGFGVHGSLRRKPAAASGTRLAEDPHERHQDAASHRRQTGRAAP